ncbi:hypothetical protein BC831DRAFT_407087, partial [Entophlyctis helioformis]
MSVPLTPALLKIDIDTIFLPSTLDVDSKILIPLLDATIGPHSPKRFKMTFVEAPSIPALPEEAEYGERCLNQAFTFYEDAWFD